MTREFPDDAAAIYRALPDVMAKLLGCTSHVADIVEREQLAASLPTVPAYFSPLTRQVVVQPSVTQSFNDFLTGPRGGLPQEALIEWNRKLFKTNLGVLMGRIAQGIGPPDVGLAMAEWDSLVRYPHVHSLVFGVCELVAELWINDAIDELGLSEFDPALKEVDMLQNRYIAQVTLIGNVLGEIARGRGSTVKQELGLLVRSGSGQLALWRLVDRWGGHSDFGNSDKLHKLAAFVDMRRSLEQNLTRMNTEWTHAA